MCCPVPTDLGVNFDVIEQDTYSMLKELTLRVRQRVRCVLVCGGDPMIARKLAPKIALGIIWMMWSKL